MPLSSNAETPRSAARDQPAILTRPLLGGGPLVRDYLAGSDLSAFYAGHHSDPAAYERKAAEVERRLDAAARAAAAPAVEALGDAAGRLRSISAGDGFFVTTGQQPALFGGPLYTLYKILGAIRLADVLERRLGRPVLALFWVGSDDHDWDEANHSALLDGAEYVHRITVGAPADAPALPLNLRRWGPDVTRAVREMGALLPDTVHADEVMEHVRSVYTPDATVTASFTATIRYLLHDRRLAIVDAAHPAVRRAAVPVLQHEVAHAREHAERIARQTQRLEQAGYRAQVAVSDDAANLMLIDESGRDRLVRSSRGWGTRRQRGGVPEAELIASIAAAPESYSPNVLLRPVIESALFPTLAYVAGPGELSYFAQIGCLFTAHDILPPIIVPRPSVTLVEPVVRRLLERLDVDADALRRPFRDVIADVIAAAMPARVRDALDDLRASIRMAYEELADAAGDIDPTLRGPLSGSRNSSLLDAAAAEKRIMAQLRRRNGVRIEQLRRAAAHIHPGGAPQERVLGTLPFVAAHGRGIVAEIEARIDMELRREAAWAGPDCA